MPVLKLPAIEHCIQFGVIAIIQPATEKTMGSHARTALIFHPLAIEVHNSGVVPNSSKIIAFIVFLHAGLQLGTPISESARSELVGSSIELFGEHVVVTQPIRHLVIIEELQILRSVGEHIG